MCSNELNWKWHTICAELFGNCGGGGIGNGVTANADHDKQTDDYMGHRLPPTMMNDRGPAYNKYTVLSVLVRASNNNITRSSPIRDALWSRDAMSTNEFLFGSAFVSFQRKIRVWYRSLTDQYRRNQFSHSRTNHHPQLQFACCTWTCSSILNSLAQLLFSILAVPTKEQRKTSTFGILWSDQLLWISVLCGDGDSGSFFSFFIRPCALWPASLWTYNLREYECILCVWPCLVGELKWVFGKTIVWKFCHSGVQLHSSSILYSIAHQNKSAQFKNELEMEIERYRWMVIENARPESSFSIWSIARNWLFHLVVQIDSTLIDGKPKKFRIDGHQFIHQHL